jgi:hypothetical protein
MFKKFVALIPVFALATAVGVAPMALALDCSTPQDCATQGVGSADTGGNNTSAGDIIKNIVNILLFIIGAVSVIMIVIGGFKYVVSNGDSSAVKGAKDTIFYAVIGLVVAILAYAVVNWVIQQFISTPSTTTP